MPILKHHLDSASAGNFGDCLRRRVRFMTAITLAYAHPYQAICLAMHLLGVPRNSFRLPPKSRYPYLPNVRSITREVGNDYHGWAIHADGVTRVVDGEIFAGWCVISRSFFMILCMLALVLARSHVQLALACQESMIRAHMCLVTVELWVTNAPIMLLPLALLGSSLAIMSSHVGFVTTLTLLSILMAATTSARLLNEYNTFEQMLRCSTRTELSIGTSHRVLCARCAPHVVHRVVAFVSLSGFCFP